MEMPKTNNQVIPSQEQQPEKKQRPPPEQAVKCPRCASTNTKFCYYNNYSLSQPRYFCKGCRRYWTQGGSLRNVPVGGGCRKNKRTNSSYNSSTAKKTTTSTLLDHHHLMPNNGYPLLPGLIAPPLSYDPSELTLAFASFHKQPNNNNFVFANTTEPISGVSAPANNAFLDILRNGLIGNNSNNLYNSLSYGVGGNVEVSSNLTGQEAIFSCEPAHGSSPPCKELDEAETKMIMANHEWQFNGDGNVNVSVDPAREYWAGVGAGCSSWQGIMNSSLM